MNYYEKQLQEASDDFQLCQFAYPNVFFVNEEFYLGWIKDMQNSGVTPRSALSYWGLPVKPDWSEKAPLVRADFVDDFEDSRSPEVVPELVQRSLRLALSRLDELEASKSPKDIAKRIDDYLKKSRGTVPPPTRQ